MLLRAPSVAPCVAPRRSRAVRCCAGEAGGSLIPETLRALEADVAAGAALRRLKEVGQRSLTREEAALRRRALDGSGVRSFDSLLDAPLRHGAHDTLQFNLGLYCNQACSHCHVESSPLRTAENADRETVERVLHLLRNSPGVRTLDLTGGAPELNPHFRHLVAEARALGLQVVDRCNLTVLAEPDQADLAAFLAHHRARVVASLPCYSESTVDAQRGDGVFQRSIAALSELNAHGYAQPGSDLVLDLMFNPAGASLPPPAAQLEGAYRRELSERFGIAFSSLLTLTNMPIKRFADRLHQQGETDAYMRLLLSSFNPETAPKVMCTRLVSVSWSGHLYDCDFNQQLDIPLSAPLGARSIWEIDSLVQLEGCAVTTDLHCLGCTAGAGSSCSGQIA